VLLVVLEQRVREVENPDHPLVSDPVVDRPVLSARVDETAPAKTGEVVGHLRLCEPEPLDELADGELALVAQQFEDAQPGRVAEAAEVLGDEVGPGRGLGKSEGRELRNC
jgi:hypothetical protein